ncbi:MAG: SprT-like domain-containing protein [Bacteroidota bacterium]
MLSPIEKAYFGLNRYLPENSYSSLIAVLSKNPLPIKVVKPRNTKLGDYRPRWEKTGKPLITINADLNPYSFLITLIHEIAHHVTWLKHQGKVKPHGEEWKAIYSEMAYQHFLGKSIFPPEIEAALKKYFTRTFASSCADPNLLRVLSNYDTMPDGHFLLEQLKEHTVFELNGRIFKKGERRRKRFTCLELSTKRNYLVSAVCSVKIIE